MSATVLLLLSGGIDSAVCVALYREQISACVGFDYGQPHLAELDRAGALAKRYGVPFERVRLPTIGKVNGIVFAARNAVLLSVGASMAAERRIESVMIGCNASDWTDFPDCRPSFFRDFGRGISDAYGVAVLAPLLRQSKAQVIATARQLGVPLDETLSCYAPENGVACGACYSCQTRAAAQ